MNRTVSRSEAGTPNIKAPPPKQTILSFAGLKLYRQIQISTRATVSPSVNLGNRHLGGGRVPTIWREWDVPY